jgi:hypothetical protein
MLPPNRPPTFDFPCSSPDSLLPRNDTRTGPRSGRSEIAGGGTQLTVRNRTACRPRTAIGTTRLRPDTASTKGLRSPRTTILLGFPRSAQCTRRLGPVLESTRMPPPRAGQDQRWDRPQARKTTATVPALAARRSFAHLCFLRRRRTTGQGESPTFTFAVLDALLGDRPEMREALGEFPLAFHKRPGDIPDFACQKCGAFPAVAASFLTRRRRGGSKSFRRCCES